MRKRRNERKAARLARMLVVLDTTACERRGWRPRPRAQLATLNAAGGHRSA